MKTASVVLSVLFVTPCLTFASVGFASGGPRQVDNSVSLQVFADLTSVGAQIDCGMGKCGTSASNVSCTLKWNGKRNILQSCDLDIQDENEAQVPVHLTGDKAVKILNALLAAEMNSAESIDCSFSNGSSQDDVKCSLQ